MAELWGKMSQNGPKRSIFEHMNPFYQSFLLWRTTGSSVLEMSATTGNCLNNGNLVTIKHKMKAFSKHVHRLRFRQDEHAIGVCCCYNPCYHCIVIFNTSLLHRTHHSCYLYLWDREFLYGATDYTTLSSDEIVI